VTAHMALTAYSIERAGTTYSTARSQRDCFTTLHCGEVAPLDLAVAHRRRALLEALFRCISLIDRMFTTPPPKVHVEMPSRRPRRGNPSSISHNPQADATSVRPACRLFTHLCHATPCTSVALVSSYPNGYSRLSPHREQFLKHTIILNQ